MNAPTLTMIPQADPGAGYRAQKAEIDEMLRRAEQYKEEDKKKRVLV